MDGRGAEHDIDIRVAFFELLGAVLLRGHAAADGNDEGGIVLFEMLVLPDDRERALFGVLADGAGIDRNQGRVLRLVGDVISHLPRQPPELLAVRLVLLTAEGEDERARTDAGLCRRGIGMRPHGTEIRHLRRGENVLLFHAISVPFLS